MKKIPNGVLTNGAECAILIYNKISVKGESMMKKTVTVVMDMTKMCMPCMRMCFGAVFSNVLSVI